MHTIYRNRVVMITRPLRTAIRGRFLTESLLCDLIFSAGKKSKQKKPLAKLCSSSNCLANLVEPSQLVLNPSK
jgi:hypothetical protein